MQPKRTENVDVQSIQLIDPQPLYSQLSSMSWNWTPHHLDPTQRPSIGKCCHFRPISVLENFWFSIQRRKATGGESQVGMTQTLIFKRSLFDKGSWTIVNEPEFRLEMVTLPRGVNLLGRSLSIAWYKLMCSQPSYSKDDCVKNCTSWQCYASENAVTLTAEIDEISRIGRHNSKNMIAEINQFIPFVFSLQYDDTFYGK